MVKLRPYCRTSPTTPTTDISTLQNRTFSFCGDKRTAMQCGPAIPLAGFHRSNNPSLQLRVAPDKIPHGDRRREMGGAEQCVESELPVRHESELGQWRRKLGSRHWLPGEPVLQRERKPRSLSEQPRV